MMQTEFPLQKELTALKNALAEYEKVGEYINDFGTMSGGPMRTKYGDDPMNGYSNVMSRFNAAQKRARAALARKEKR